MSLNDHYDVIAEQVVESLFDSHMDLDRFLPALHRAMLSRVKDIVTSGDDYEVEDQNWAANQEWEAKLYLNGLSDAISDLECALIAVLPTDDQIIVGRMKSASAKLQNLKQRMK